MEFFKEYFDEISSTNDMVKARAASGEEEGLVVIADRQTGGRGRMGRTFFSPGGSGAYFSVLLRPKLTPQESTLITTAAAVAVSEAIDEISGLKTGIKWVNDVFCGGRKLCGILTEAELLPDMSALSCAVMGIGINLTEPEGGFPQDIRNIAGSVFGKKAPEDARDRLIDMTLMRFAEYYRSLAEKPHFDEYARRLICMGREITVIRSDGARDALCTGIDEDFRLLVKYGDGAMEALYSGEISIKL